MTFVDKFGVILEVCFEDRPLTMCGFFFYIYFMFVLENYWNLTHNQVRKIGDKVFLFYVLIKKLLRISLSIKFLLSYGKILFSWKFLLSVVMNSKKALIKSIMKIICLIKMIILLSNDTSLNGILLFWIMMLLIWGED